MEIGKTYKIRGADCCISFEFTATLLEIRETSYDCITIWSNGVKVDGYLDWELV